MSSAPSGATPYIPEVDSHRLLCHGLGPGPPGVKENKKDLNACYPLPPYCITWRLLVGHWNLRDHSKVNTKFFLQFVIYIR